ncbi:hypothetical protein QFZ42_002349 [Variovorax paradoxus]|uniref:hypothetical protein n=1 Tax=Variovorax paradoxus TaxID=34073 RepID=UPI002790C099|nr:hypothetical protein [Variovorax paradoxus]MDQ0570515.1 hypothetical protein [Variovorax paradoxus]
MRRIIQVPEGVRPETPDLPSLSMDESVWEDGYSLVIDELAHGALQTFWKHYYGASAEMVISGQQLAEFRKEIMAAAPNCASKPAVLEFLMQLARICARARRQKHSLHVVAD